ncbi:unnamed protein product [Gongylonema pulchrum]|uniref:RWD domain-containing protein n=1 Tax=Gongylonema pulchrum TaxID=637853 RepID=A0A183D1M5_9BILA|nr:unnamed protein product [Gongylonema pulchrum]
MDYETTQQEELEALEAIYPDELEITCNEYPNISLKISLHSHPDKDAENTPHTFQVTLVLQLPASYPDIIPVIEIQGLEDCFSSERIERVQRTLCGIAQDSLSMPMVFTIVSSLQEEIGHLVEDFEARKIKAEEEAKEQKEALERKKFEAGFSFYLDQQLLTSA